MKPVDAAVLGIVWFGSHLVVSVDDVRPVGIDLDLSHVVRKVDERFLSVALDASLIAEEKFMNLLSLPRLRTLARALTPAFLRFGGTQQDFMKFSPAGKNISSGYRRHFEHSCESLNFPPLLEKRLKEEWILQSNILLQEELEGQYRKTKFSEYAVDLLYTFANCSGFHLIFGLNALFRTSENAWNSRNAELLLKYCESKRYAMSWELGNEPNSYVKKAGVRVEGYQLGQDFVHLRQILQESTVYRSSDLYGPDISQPRDHRKDLLTGFLETGSKAISACTWHHYYVNGRDASLEDFLDPVVLNSLAAKINEVLKIVRSVSPGKKVWLGETSSAYDGGAAGLSDTFVAGFMWLDKLGLSAKLGLDVVIRQVLIGSGSYHLVDENLDPLPDYWLSLLYKRLVGPEVLRVLKTSRAEPAVRLYLHCTNRKSEHYRPGAVTLFALNLEGNQATVRLAKHVTNSTIEAFVLQAAEDGKQGLYSRTVRLNGKVLKMLDDQTLPVLQGRKMAAGRHITLPGFSLAFYVLTEAGSPVC